MTLQLDSTDNNVMSTYSGNVILYTHYVKILFTQTVT